MHGKRGLNIIMDDKKPNNSIHKEISFSKKSRFELMSFNENPNVGVFCRTNDDVVFIRKSLTKKVKRKIVETLDIKLVEISIADATIIGSLIAFNSHGVVVTDFIDNKAIKIFENEGFKVCIINDK